MSQREKRHDYRSGETGAAAYDAEYYRTGCGPAPYEHNEYWVHFFGAVADALIQYLKPQTVFDAGCALGFLVEALRDRGVQAWGADISEFAIQNVREDIRPYCRVASITDPIAGPDGSHTDTHYDVVACIEVLEHLTAEEAARTIANITAITGAILFSSSPCDVTEPTHINVRPPLDWLKLFAAHGFSPDLGFNSSLLSPQAMLLRRDAPGLSHDLQVFYNDAILLNSAIVRQDPDVPPAAKVPSGHLLGNAFTKTVEMMRVGDQLADFVQKNTEMGHLIDGISVVNQDMLKRNADLERRNEELSRRLAQAILPGADKAASERLHAPLTDFERERLMKIFDRTFYLDQNPDICDAVSDSNLDPFLHFMEHGWREGRCPHPLFDTAFYLVHHPELVESGLNPLLHYMRTGVLTGSNPHPLFDTVFYLHEYTDVADAGLNPLHHFIEHGAHERRNPHPFFNTADYLAANPDVAASGANALIHYVRSGAGEGRPLRIPITREDRTPYEIRISRTEPDTQELHLQKAVSRQFLLQPVISIVVPVYRLPFAVLKAMVESVKNQTYTRWELCLAHGDPEDHHARAWLRTLAQEDPRIKVKLLEENLGISGNSNRALALATGEFVGLLDHDDTLAPFALYEVAKVINEKPDVDFIYSDKDCLNEQGERSERISPLFKPRWSPDLMLSANYLTHFCVMRMEHLRAIRGWRPETDGAQDWDLFFRVIERSKKIEFIDKVLYHWGIVATSVASGGVQSKPYALRSQLQTISERLARIAKNGKPLGKPTLESNGAMRVRWELPALVSVTIILVSDDPGERMLEHARKLRSSITHQAVEIVVAMPDVAGNRAGKSNGHVLAVATPPGATLAQRLNAAVAASSGWGIIFLDDCVDIGKADWLPELVGPLQLDNVGLVGSRLMDPETHTIRHAGIVFNRDGDLAYIFAGESEHAYGVFGGPSWCRNWSAVSGACFAIRREVFEQAGGFSENPRYPRLDIDLCLRVTVQLGWRIFYNSYAQFQQGALTRLEQWLQIAPDAARDYARKCLPLGDPFFHPRLRCRDGKIILDFGEDTVTPRIDYAAEARALTSGFDFSPAVLTASRSLSRLSSRTGHKPKRLAWFLPEFTHPFYGGIHTILRAADYFQRVHQVHSTFLTPCPEVVIRSAIRAAFPALAGACGLVEFTSYSQLPSLPPYDAAIATLWTTAYSVLQLQNARRKFYFMQDYESRFYPAGSISAMVESTYHFGFSAICNTVSLRDIYTGAGGRAEYFDPCIDPAIFHAKNRTPLRDHEPLTLFCYARPSHVRNSFELLSRALQLLKKRLGNDVRIVTAGADWSPRQLGLDGIVHNLGLLPYSATGALYRSCTAGVALMMTCHPSYLPFELMASGALVITNSNPYNSWLLKDRENCLLAESSPSALADALEEGLRNRQLRAKLVENAARIIQDKYSDWDKQMEKIHRYICDSL
jgi:cellulose synthase/poly-beta-1,6-N-acetylglucosamine synthase-like glycosyltransferase/glycosyltransferase involved in cell wall biosynthesis